MRLTTVDRCPGGVQVIIKEAVKFSALRNFMLLVNLELTGVAEKVRRVEH